MNIQTDKKSDNIVSLQMVKNKKDYEQELFFTNHGFLLNCDIETRWGESFWGYNSEGHKVVTLKGYKILPKEIYKERTNCACKTWGFLRRLKFLFTSN